jgi:mRNA interferase MazF
MVSFPRRGEIYWVDLNPAAGSEQRGVRPAVIVQNDVGNEFSPTTIIVPLSSKVSKTSYLVNVVLPDGLLPKPSVAKCGQMRTIDKARLREGPVARLDAESLARVDDALRLSLGL